MTGPPLAWARGTPDQRRAWRRYWIDDVVMGVREIVLHFALKLLPIDACTVLGARIGPLVGPLDAKADARVRKNLAILRPNWTPAELEAGRLRNWRNVGRALGEFSVLRRLWRSSRTVVEGLENLAAARALGVGRVYIAVHLGNWEMFGPKVLELGDVGDEFYQPPRNRFQRWIAERTRRRFDDHLLAPGPSSTMRALRRLKSGGAIVMFMDDFTGGRVNGPALGRPLSASSSLGTAVRLAQATGTVVMPGYVLREAGRTRFRMHILPHIDVGDLTPEDGMARVNDVLEPIVRAHLDQWYMLHELRDLEPTAPG